MGTLSRFSLINLLVIIKMIIKKNRVKCVKLPVHIIFSMNPLINKIEQYIDNFLHDNMSHSSNMHTVIGQEDEKDKK